MITTESRLLALGVAAGLCWLTACETRQGAGAERKRPTPAELVQTWAGPNNEILHYRDVAVPGFELFWIQGINEQGSNGFAVAVPVDEQNFLEGKYALRQLIAAGVSDPLELARLSMVFLERGGAPLAGPENEHHRTAGVTPPAVEGGVLSYYYERRARSFIELLRTRMSLNALEPQTSSMALVETPHQ